MKNLILILSTVFLFVSCKKDKDESVYPKQQEEQTIIGIWNLTKSEGGFSPTNNFSNEIQWTFSSDNTISVIIKEGTVIENNNIPFTNNGTHSYSKNDSIIILDNNYSYYYEIHNNRLLLKESKQAPTDDGNRITFIRK